MDISKFRFNGRGIPERMHGGIQRYIEQHAMPGDFLMAVVCNNLKEACARADDENMLLLPVYAAFFYHEAPAACWGSPEKVRAWLDGGEQAAGG